MCVCVRVRVCVNFRMCLNVCVWMSVIPLNIWCSRWLLFVAAERDATNVWLAQYLCTVFISTVFFSINFSIRSESLLSLFPFCSIFFIPFFSDFVVVVPFDERYARTIRIFPLIFSLSWFCSQKGSNSMSLSLYLSFTYSFLLLSATHKNRMMRKAQVKRCTIVFILFICCRRFCVCVSVFFLLVFDYFYLTWFCCNTSSFFIAGIGCCFSSNERREKKQTANNSSSSRKKEKKRENEETRALR